MLIPLAIGSRTGKMHVRTVSLKCTDFLVLATPFRRPHHGSGPHYALHRVCLYVHPSVCFSVHRLADAMTVTDSNYSQNYFWNIRKKNDKMR